MSTLNRRWKLVTDIEYQNPLRKRDPGKTRHFLYGKITNYSRRWNCYNRADYVKINKATQKVTWKEELKPRETFQNKIKKIEDRLVLVVIIHSAKKNGKEFNYR